MISPDEILKSVGLNALQLDMKLTIPVESFRFLARAWRGLRVFRPRALSEGSRVGFHHLLYSNRCPSALLICSVG
jgi:hypothetical protein